MKNPGLKFYGLLVDYDKSSELLVVFGSSLPICGEDWQVRGGWGGLALCVGYFLLCDAVTKAAIWFHFVE